MNTTRPHAAASLISSHDRNLLVYDLLFCFSLCPHRGDSPAGNIGTDRAPSDVKNRACALERPLAETIR